MPPERRPLGRSCGGVCCLLGTLSSCFKLRAREIEGRGRGNMVVSMRVRVDGRQSVHVHIGPMLVNDGLGGYSRQWERCREPTSCPTSLMRPRVYTRVRMWGEVSVGVRMRVGVGVGVGMGRTMRMPMPATVGGSNGQCKGCAHGPLRRVGWLGWQVAVGLIIDSASRERNEVVDCWKGRMKSQPAAPGYMCQWQQHCIPRSSHLWKGRAEDSLASSIG
jgi:hypothetical protein